MAIKVSLDTAEIAPRILEVYLASGRSIRAAADALGKDRQTVRKIVRAYESGEWDGKPIIDAPSVGRADNTVIGGGDDWKAAFREWAGQNGVPVPPELQAGPHPTVAPREHPHKVNITYAPADVRRVAFISDVHVPFEDKLGVQAMLKYLADFEPDQIILGGDIFDFYLASDHDKDPGRAQTIQDEFDAGRYFFKAINELAPSVVFMEGNHEQRLQRMIARNPGLYKLRALEFRHAAELPETWRCYPSQTHYRIGGLLVLHGDLRGRGTGVKHAAAGMLSKLRTSCIFGHLHRFGTHYETDYAGTVRAGFANGHLSDVREAKYITSPDWQSGFSTICFGSSQDIFAVQQHLIVEGRFVVDGKEYVL